MASAARRAGPAAAVGVARDGSGPARCGDGDHRRNAAERLRRATWALPGPFDGGAERGVLHTAFAPPTPASGSGGAPAASLTVYSYADGGRHLFTPATRHRLAATGARQSRSSSRRSTPSPSGRRCSRSPKVAYVNGTNDVTVTYSITKGPLRHPAINLPASSSPPPLVAGRDSYFATVASSSPPRRFGGSIRLAQGPSASWRSAPGPHFQEAAAGRSRTS